ncbi:MAG TPA: hypothetical protein VMT67_17525 [Terriglobales bacterium]|nr:hypothetical protein [Terriglobales bacterium]
MDVLNVGAGRTDEEYKHAKEVRRDELREDSHNDANYFFWAAGLAATSSGILPITIHFLINIGVFDLLALYRKHFAGNFQTVAEGTVVMWILVLCGLGFAARKGYRWAFILGIAIYALDMLALLAVFSIWAFGVHGFFVFRWFQGQKALKELNEPIPIAATS